jgi:hypothetical protein
MVVRGYNLNYSEGGDQKDHGLRQAQANSETPSQQTSQA